MEMQKKLEGYEEKIMKKAVLLGKRYMCIEYQNMKWNVDDESACRIVSYEKRNVTHRWWSRDLSRANEDGT